MTLDWRRLLEEATRAEPFVCSSIDEAVDVVHAVLTRRNLGVKGGARLVFAAGQCGPLAEEIARLDSASAAGAAVSVLERPDRVIALAGDAASNGTRSVALLGVRRVETSAIGTIVSVEQERPLRGRPPELTAVDLTSTAEWDGFTGFPRDLETLWRSASPSARKIEPPPRPRPRTAVLLGEPGNYRMDDWRVHVASLGAVRGIRVDIIPDPQENFHSARDIVIANGRDLLIAVGGDGLSSAIGAIVAEFNDREPDHTAIVVQDADGADVLDLVRMEVDERINNVVARPGATPTIAEVIASAESNYEEVIEVWGSAHDAAKRSRYPRPRELESVLRAIYDLALVYAQSLKDGASPMGPWDSWFRERGLEYTAHESESTMNKFSAERTFTQGARTTTFQKHFTLGGGDRAACLQVYFELDESKARVFADAPDGDEREAFVVIGYCGVHLPYATQRT